MITSPLVPPPLTQTQLELSPETFSAFALGLSKTGLSKHLKKKSRKNGGTTFVPTNDAFRRLGRRANAFLFSKRGEHCLRALLQYHLVLNQTLYSDVLYTSSGRVEEFRDKIEKGVHVVLATGLGNRTVSVDLNYRHRHVVMRVNGFERAVELDRIARDGVVHVLDRVLIPPKIVGGKEVVSEDVGEMSPEELEGRLLGEWVDEAEQRIHAEL